jgi:hypothetical protein
MSSNKQEFPNGTKYFNEQGLLHRTDGPAVEHKDGYKSWYINGQWHREDGPAVEWNDGNKSWYLNGKEYSEQEWEQEVINLKLKRILDL